MSTIAEVSDAPATGFSREGVEAVSRARLETGASREARLRGWELYESLPMPQRTDEEWRRTDLRMLKLDRLRPSTSSEAPGISPPQALEEAGVEDAAAQIALGPNAGVVVQRDAATILATLDPEVAAQGVIYTDLATAYREVPGAGRALLHDPGGAADLGQVRGAARRILAGWAIPLRAEGRHDRAAVPGVQPDLGAGRGGLFAHPGRDRGGGGGVHGRRFPLAVAGGAVVRLGGGRVDCRRRMRSCATCRSRTGAATSGTS